MWEVCGFKQLSSLAVLVSSSVLGRDLDLIPETQLSLDLYAGRHIELLCGIRKRAREHASNLALLSPSVPGFLAP